MSEQTAIIIGAGPAGLTAAHELIEETDIKPIVYEMTNDIGGISKTVNYKGNRIDIGGHRFFSKSDRVMRWWQRFFPLQGAPAIDDIELGRKVLLSKEPEAPDPQNVDRVMLVRRRVSRIFFERNFYDYPVSLNWNTISNLGTLRILKIGLSYMKSCLLPVREVKTLEQFFINRFGRELYLTFFKDYTEKVWGIPCGRISPEWGAQRVKGLSIGTAVLHVLKQILAKDPSIGQKNTETTLIEQFMYPKYGPGQMWEEVARSIEKKGGQVYLAHKVVGLTCRNGKINEVKIRNESSGKIITVKGDYFFSTMPVRDLVESLGKVVPDEVRNVAQGLVYRDFITVGLLLKKLKIKNKTKLKTINNIIPDNWIYIQERDVKLGRLQIFNNWSPYMVNDGNKVWLGLEYFCNQHDGLWCESDNKVTHFAVDELAKIGVIEKSDVLDYAVIRMPKTYPAYFGTYDRFGKIRQFVDQIQNLFLVGRNGMHRYNNQDHSMLASMIAVENIINNVETKENIWQVNAEEEYHEAKRS